MSDQSPKSGNLEKETETQTPRNEDEWGSLTSDESEDIGETKYRVVDLVEESNLWNITIGFLENHGALRFSLEPVGQELLSLK